MKVNVDLVGLVAFVLLCVIIRVYRTSYTLVFDTLMAGQPAVDCTDGNRVADGGYDGAFTVAMAHAICFGLSTGTGLNAVITLLGMPQKFGAPLWKRMSAVSVGNLAFLFEAAVVYGLLSFGTKDICYTPSLSAAAGAGQVHVWRPVRFVWVMMSGATMARLFLNFALPSMPSYRRYLATAAYAIGYGLIYFSNILTGNPAAYAATLAIGIAVIAAALISLGPATMQLVAAAELEDLPGAMPRETTGMRMLKAAAGIKLKLASYALLKGAIVPLLLVALCLATSFNAISPRTEALLFPVWDLLRPLLTLQGLSVREMWSAEESIERQLANIETERTLADARNSAKRTFMRYIFHELRVPLNAISLGLDDMYETVEEETAVQNTGSPGGDADLTDADVAAYETSPSPAANTTTDEVKHQLLELEMMSLGPVAVDHSANAGSSSSFASSASTNRRARDVAKAALAPTLTSPKLRKSSVSGPAPNGASDQLVAKLRANRLQLVEKLKSSRSLVSEIASTVGILRGNAAAMGKLLDDFLSLEKIEEGRFEIEPVQFKVRLMVDDAIRMFASPLAAKHISTAVQVDPRIPETIRGDVHKLRQVLCNYISNAIKFSPEGGKIVVSVAGAKLRNPGGATHDVPTAAVAAAAAPTRQESSGRLDGVHAADVTAHFAGLTSTTSSDGANFTAKPAVTSLLRPLHWLARFGRMSSNVQVAPSSPNLGSNSDAGSITSSIGIQPAISTTAAYASTSDVAVHSSVMGLSRPPSDLHVAIHGGDHDAPNAGAHPPVPPPAHMLSSMRTTGASMMSLGSPSGPASIVTSLTHPASPGGGAGVNGLTSPMATPGTSDGQLFIRFSVTDQGVGISKEDQAKLFQPFNQIKAGALQKGNGTGLGLSICKRIIELSGGRVGVKSRPGHGATFFFQVPAAGPLTIGVVSPGAASATSPGLASLQHQEQQHSSASSNNMSFNIGPGFSSAGLVGSSSDAMGTLPSMTSGLRNSTSPSSMIMLSPGSRLGVITEGSGDTHGQQQQQQQGRHHNGAAEHTDGRGFPVSSSSASPRGIVSMPAMLAGVASNGGMGVPRAVSFQTDDATNERRAYSKQRSSKASNATSSGHPSFLSGLGAKTRTFASHFTSSSSQLMMTGAATATSQRNIGQSRRLSGLDSGASTGLNVNQSVRYIETMQDLQPHITMGTGADSRYSGARNLNGGVGGGDAAAFDLPVIAESQPSTPAPDGSRAVSRAGEATTPIHSQHSSAPTAASAEGGGGSTGDNYRRASTVGPATTLTAAAAATDASSADLPRLRTCVVVDDVSSNRLFFGKMLQRRGVTTIHTAEDGEQAVQLLDTLSAEQVAAIQCWFLDKEMPNCDGHQCASRLRARGVTVPIFGVTGNALEEDRREFMAAGVNGVITKPVKAADVEMRLKGHGLLLAA